jgi:hypothetical protein
MSGQVRVAGAHPTTDPVRTTVPPLTHTSVRVPFAMPSGSKTVPVSVSTQDASGNEATWGGAIGSEPSVASASVPSAPATAHHSSIAAPHAKGTSLPSPTVIVVALLFLAAAVWFALEFRRSRAGRRARVAVPPVVGPAPDAGMPVPQTAPVDAGQMGAVASQLAALVASIDRLVARLGEAPTAVRAPYSPSVAPPEPVPTRAPANPAPMFFAPAAQRGPEVEFDPYDWPTQQQLDDFAARRRAAQSDS